MSRLHPIVGAMGRSPGVFPREALQNVPHPIEKVYLMSVWDRTVSGEDG
ncbi:MAG TPA: hypothetical protein IGS17_19595 [Oscillatoriales cyanobacterium M59_W2019_021]|nr:hypothetical protein [Oscillatoriales cyanobacterium M4454_W2019_049]HIK53100.1 hypothetical protein [Oscillatoriales cyanobacterium M59_W2019_021]